MDPAYVNKVIEAARQKLKEAGKPISESELIRGTVHRLKKQYGEEDLRYTNKARFKRDTFRYIVQSPIWKEKISELPGKRFDLFENYAINIESESDPEFSWSNKSLDEASEFVLRILKKMDNYQFENLVQIIASKKYDCKFEVTQKSGDLGVDVVGTKSENEGNGKIERFYIQVKRYNKSVSRDQADNFIGAVTAFCNSNGKSFSKVTALFVTTGTLSTTFEPRLKDSEAAGITYLCWDGRRLVKNMLELGLGVRFSIDTDFWNNADPLLIPKCLKTDR